MALSEPQVLALQIDYELGKLSKTSICKKHRVSRPTLRKHATENGWVYQKTFQEVSKEVEKRTIAKLVEENADIVTQATEKFLSDSAYIRDFVMDLIKRVQKELDENSYKTKDVDLSGFTSLQKMGETLSKTIISLYSTERKALGLDIDDDIEKAKRIKGNDKQQAVDPLDGMTEEDIDKQLKEYE